MVSKLEFSFVTSEEKFYIMTSIPEKELVESVGKQIKNNRIFHDNKTKKVFEEELKSLIYSRSHGLPKKMKKPKK